MTITPGMQRSVPLDYATVLAKLPDVLKSEGFGVLTEIDVRDTLKAKLGIEFRRYKILGACNPPLAHKVLQSELGAGVMLPCNVVVYEQDPANTMVIAVDPMQTLAADHDALRPIAEEVRGKLERVLEKIT